MVAAVGEADAIVRALDDFAAEPGGQVEKTVLRVFRILCHWQQWDPDR
ncbi:MAG: hypothetical protein P8M79_03740 [Alphaproteobacteria bacterium]|nr:hypothetical protein [Alphaproteobacteria bacterium]